MVIGRDEGHVIPKKEDHFRHHFDVLFLMMVEKFIAGNRVHICNFGVVYMLSSFLFSGLLWVKTEHGDFCIAFTNGQNSGLVSKELAFVFSFFSFFSLSPLLLNNPFLRRLIERLMVSQVTRVPPLLLGCDIRKQNSRILGGSPTAVSLPFYFPLPPLGFSYV